MHTPVNFESAKLLKEKGYNEDNPWNTINWYSTEGRLVPEDETEDASWAGITFECGAPTIANAVMWLYEKHGIWIYADSHEFGKWCYYYRFNRPNELYPRITENGQFSLEDYNSPTEAYEAAISYTLNNLI